MQKQKGSQYTGNSRYPLPSQELCENYAKVDGFPVHRKFRAPLPLSKQSMGALSGGEIHCLRRLRNEGAPEIP